MLWLYRYIFRGSKVLFALGMLTILVLAVVHEMRRSAERPPTRATQLGRLSQ
jgi:hypothetical protein